MRATPPSPPTEPAAPIANARPHASTSAERERIRHEVEHLFRHSLREGHINPLMHLIIDHRAGDLR